VRVGERRGIVKLPGATYSFEASEVGLRPSEEPTAFVHDGIIFRDVERLFHGSDLSGWRLTSDDGDVLTIFND
jgi:hypothetical protein|tara:strand:+ start:7470 stop:7688 length:219 start_codon:yes stop_codon:yes gene_type:complete